MRREAQSPLGFVLAHRDNPKMSNQFRGRAASFPGSSNLLVKFAAEIDEEHLMSE